MDIVNNPNGRYSIELGKCDICRGDKRTTRVVFCVRPGVPVMVYEICRPCAQQILSSFKRRRK
jgi:hypothetical protein